VREVLVVANRTLSGAKLLEAVRARTNDGPVRFRLVVPQSNPSAGLVIYDEAVRESAQVRVDLALSAVASEHPAPFCEDSAHLLEALLAKAGNGEQLFDGVLEKVTDPLDTSPGKHGVNVGG